MLAKYEFKKYPITNEGFAQSIPINKNSIWEYMNKYGFIVCSVLATEECDQSVKEYWNECNELGNGCLNSDDPSTWKNENWPNPKHPFLATHFTATTQSFKNMVNPNIVQIYEILYKTNKIIPIIGVQSIKRPTIINGTMKPEWRVQPLKLHWDRDTELKYTTYPDRYAGTIALVDCGYDMGEFCWCTKFR